jgi:hypothetical protein
LIMKEIIEFNIKNYVIWFKEAKYQILLSLFNQNELNKKRNNKMN